MFHLLLEGRFAIVRHVLEVCLELQSHSDQTRGICPTSFVEQGQELIADYGQRSIGRISSVDASLWWPVLSIPCRKLSTARHDRTESRERTEGQ
jgi:beta-fructofuranosidase